MAADERDLDAGERALEGAADAEERRRDRRLREAWQRRLAPLAELLEPVSPPAELFDAVMRRIDVEELGADLARERRRAARWRLSAAAMTVAAAALLLLVVLPDRDEPPTEYVAVVTRDGGGPALVVDLDLEDGVATVRPVGVEAPATGSLELWVIEEGMAPRSLGLIQTDQPIRTPLEAAPGDLIAVSHEPAGGSPTGQPTGPVLYSGRLVAVE